MISPIKSILGPWVAKTRVVPLVTKIVVLVTVFLLVSNFASNFINLELNRGEQQKLANQILVKDLAELYGFANTQNEIYSYNGDLGQATKAISESAAKNLGRDHSVAFGLKPDGSFLFWSSRQPRPAAFADAKALAAIAAAKGGEGKLDFEMGGSAYFGVFKYDDKWGAFIVRAEERSEFQRESDAIFYRVAGIIFFLTAVFIVLGALLVGRILRFVGRITQSLMKMQAEQKLELIDLSGAPNDQVSFLGASFNSLSSTINNLMSIFRRFVTQDIAQRAYVEREVRLEGTTKDLTILFSDIKGFTFMTETLGNDIIDLLNLHYQRAIGGIHEESGIVGSIIGDALLAVFGTMPGTEHKSLHALRAAYKIQETAAELRREMHEKREAIIRKRGDLTDKEEAIFKAVLLEVGVGLDGGEVFYGNIGSYERMTNTVIGDNVNSSSRLEGLTRVYKVPVVCSAFIKEEVESLGNEYRFLEIDTVQVKGKTIGKRIYWPVRSSEIDDALESEFEAFSEGLTHYYDGDWARALLAWQGVTLPLAGVFRERIAGYTVPADWNGIWAMTTK